MFKMSYKLHLAQQSEDKSPYYANKDKLLRLILQNNFF